MLEGVRQGEQCKVLQGITTVGPSDEVAQSDGIREGSRDSSLVNSDMRVKCIQQVLMLDVTSIVVDVSVIGKGLSEERIH